jgi:hypothetical protein
MNLKSFTSFDRMITPVIIKVLFWIGVGISVLSGIGLFFTGIVGGIMNSSFGQVLGGLFGGPLTIILGILITRIYSELLIVIFQINESLTDIKEMKKE